MLMDPSFWAYITSRPEQRPEDTRRSQKRKWRVWRGRDWASWANGGIILLWAVLAAAPVSLQQLRIGVLEYQNRLLASTLEASAADATSQYVRRSGNGSIIVFVHGLFGNAVATWTCSTSRAYWPALLAEDPAFGSYDVYTVGFSSFASFGEVSERVYRGLVDDGVFASYLHVTFVTHGAGETVVKQMILKHRDVLPKVKLIVSYGQVEIGRFSSVLPGRIRELLVPGGGDWQAALAAAWDASNPKVPVYCALETRGLSSVPILPLVGSHARCTGEAAAIDADHVDLVKPCGTVAPAYVFLKSTLQKQQ